MPFIPPVPGHPLGPVLHDIAEAVRTSSNPSAWDYARDIVSLVTAIASVWIAVMVSRYQREQDQRNAAETARLQALSAAETLRQQAEATRLEWVRLFIIEPRRDDIFAFFEQLEQVLQQVNHSPLTQDECTDIVAEINRHVNQFERQFLTYTDSITGSVIPAKLRELIENLRDEIGEGIDQLDDSVVVASYRALVAKVINARNTFLGALYSLTFQ